MRVSLEEKIANLVLEKMSRNARRRKKQQKRKKQQSQQSGEFGEKVEKVEKGLKNKETEGFSDVDDAKDLEGETIRAVEETVQGMQKIEQKLTTHEKILQNLVRTVVKMAGENKAEKSAQPEPPTSDSFLKDKFN